MAVPLVYNSCLFNDALEEAVEDYMTVSKEKEEQDKQKQDFNDAKQSKLDAGEAFEEEEPEWKGIEFAPFKTFKEEYVICLDTLGQDR